MGRPTTSGSSQVFAMPVHAERRERDGEPGAGRGVAQVTARGEERPLHRRAVDRRDGRHFGYVTVRQPLR